VLRELLLATGLARSVFAKELNFNYISQRSAIFDAIGKEKCNQPAEIQFPTIVFI